MAVLADSFKVGQTPGLSGSPGPAPGLSETGLLACPSLEGILLRKQNDFQVVVRGRAVRPVEGAKGPSFPDCLSTA